MTITHVFFDVGGVLGTRGWDAGQRTLAAERFGLDEHLDCAVFDVPRSFSHDEFKTFMRALSEPLPETIAVARALAGVGRYRLMTINNESAELNVYRLRHFGFTGIFALFFSSCWLGVAKPSRRIYELALSMSQAEPEQSVFIDDRAENLPPARALGMRTVRFVSAGQLAADLAAPGIAIGERGGRLCNSR